jgi:hypothetical protein
MKIITIILLFTLTSSLVAQQSDDDLSDRILRISENLLAGYAQPLVNVFGTGVSSGLFHSAYSHDFLGFDLGVRLLYIEIPRSAKYFNGTVLICSLAVDSMIHLVQYEVELESLSTVFGPWEETIVPTQGYSLAIPPIIPGGFNLSGIPLATPQLNIGLVFGSEIAFRYVPYTFEGTKMRFFGFGFKQQLTKLPPLSLARLPFAIAVAGAYQKFTVETPGRETIISSKTTNLQAIISARIGALEPMVAFGIENTTADFDYIFEYEIPDTISGIPFEQLTIHEEISVHLKGENRHRTVVGLTLNMGLLFMHYDYNITPYSTHNLTLGFSWR